MGSVKIGAGSISLHLLQLDKDTFLSSFPVEFKRLLIPNTDDDSIDVILTDLWLQSNPGKADGGDTVIKKNKTIKKATTNAD
jgi:hypothetical protein